MTTDHTNSHDTHGVATVPTQIIKGRDITPGMWIRIYDDGPDHRMQNAGVRRGQHFYQVAAVTPVGGGYAVSVTLADGTKIPGLPRGIRATATVEAVA